MAPKKDDPIERLEGAVNKILDQREQRVREEKDPKARFDRIMDRLEKFLDGAEGSGREKPKPAEKDDEDGGIVQAIFGAK